MASPLAPFANARILWTAPGVRSSGLEGYKLQPGQAYLIEAFLKRWNTNAKLLERFNLPAVGGFEAYFGGYVLRYAEVTPEEAEDFVNVDLSGLTWDDSMLLPAGLKRDAAAKLYIPGLNVLDVRFSDKAGQFGTAGIGSIIRGVLGDEIFLDGGQVG